MTDAEVVGAGWDEKEAAIRKAERRRCAEVVRAQIACAESLSRDQVVDVETLEGILRDILAAITKLMGKSPADYVREERARIRRELIQNQFIVEVPAGPGCIAGLEVIPRAALDSICPEKGE